jgi:hypothetical protein
MRGGYRGKPKPKLPSHLKRVHVNARIQQWMLDELRRRGEVGIILEDILIKAGFKYQPKNEERQDASGGPAGYLFRSKERGFDALRTKT